MKVEFKNSFVKDLKPIKDKKLLSRVQATILSVEQADSLQDITQCKKLQGSDNYFCISIGGFRIGLSLEDETVSFVRFLSRGDIYKHFP